MVSFTEPCKNWHLLFVACFLVHVFPLTAAAAGKKPAQNASAKKIATTKACLENKIWSGQDVARTVLSPLVSTTAERPPPQFLLDTSLGALATVSDSTTLRFKNGKLTGRSIVKLSGISSTGSNKRLDGTYDGTLKTNYALKAQGGKVIAKFSQTTKDTLAVTLYLLNLSTFLKSDEVKSDVGPAYLSAGTEWEVTCKGKNLTLIFADASEHKFNR